MSSSFINRHGNRASASESQWTPNQSIAQPTPRKRFIAIPRHIKHRVTFIGVVVVVIIAMISLVLLDSVKRGYERQSAAMRRNVADLAKTMPSQDKTAAQAAASIHSSLAADSSCATNGLDLTGWYPPAKQARDTCLQTADDYVKLKNAVSEMQASSEYLEKVSSALKNPLAPPTESQFAITGDYIRSWRDANDRILALTVPPAMAAAHDEIADRTKNILEAWQQLEIANKDQDQNAFASSETSLAQAYVDMRATSVSAESALQAVQKKILYHASRLDTKN